MATGLVVPRLLEKLRYLQNDEVIVHAGLEDRVRRIMAVLNKSIPKRIRDAENRLTSSDSIDQSLGEFVRRLNLLDDITDTHLVKKEQRRLQKKSLIKKMCVCPLIPRSSGQSDGQIHLSNQMDEFLTYAEALYKDEEHEEAPRDDADMGRQLQETRSKNVSYLEDIDDSNIIVGFKKESEELANRLTSTDYNDRRVIAVVGKAGSGKTALTRNVYNRADIKENFQVRAWVRYRKGLLLDIWTQLSGKRAVNNSLNDEDLRGMVEKFLERKTCLLVMDDIRFDKKILPLIRRGRSRVVLITNENDILPQDATITLRSLTNEESWTLFMKKANIAEDSWNNNDPVIVNLKENILRKCDGWPPSIALLGGLLSTRDLTKWSSVIDKHQNFQQILASSYKELPYQMKSCFLFLAFFPRDIDIPVRRLFRLWDAEGLVAPEDLAEKYFKVLANRNMIEVARLRLDGSPKTCRVPSNQWDVLNKILVALNDVSFSQRYIIIHHPQEMFYLSDKYRWLKVLDLEGTYKPVLLSESLGYLCLLKYLGLRRTFLDSLTVSIGDLPYLETLDIKHTRITTLNSSIWNSKNLRHLYMNNIHFHIPFENTNTTTTTTTGSSLTNLQTLWGLFIGDKSLVESCLNKSIGLRKLGLTCLPTLVGAVSNWVSKLTSLQSLRLRSCDEFGRASVLDRLETLRQHNNLYDLYLLGKLPTGLIEANQLPTNLKILTLSASQIEKDPMPVLSQLPYLNILRLFGHSYLGKKMTCAGGFPELRVLKLWMLENLEEWNVQQGAMPRLRELEIRRCDALKVVNGLQKVTSLKDIILTSMPEGFVADAVRFMEMNVSAIKVNQWSFAPHRIPWHRTSKP